jgi:hypothetical protein
MAHPWHHAERSARLFGGTPEDYIAIHNWFDESKAFVPDFRHRALRHHSEGIFMCERIFGVVIDNSDGKRVPVRLLGEQHVKDDLGWVPTVNDWLGNLQIQPWMGQTKYRPTRDAALKEAGVETEREEPGARSQELV